MKIRLVVLMGMLSICCSEKQQQTLAILYKENLMTWYSKIDTKKRNQLAHLLLVYDLKKMQQAYHITYKHKDNQNY